MQPNRHTACGLYAHVTWHTWRRIRVIREYDVRLIVESVREAGRRTHVRVHAQAVLSDHVHVVVSYPPHATLAAFVRDAKPAVVSRLLRRLTLAKPRLCGAVLPCTAGPPASPSRTILAWVANPGAMPRGRAAHRGQWGSFLWRAAR